MNDLGRITCNVSDSKWYVENDGNHSLIAVFHLFMGCISYIVGSVK